VEKLSSAGTAPTEGGQGEALVPPQKTVQIPRQPSTKKYV